MLIKLIYTTAVSWGLLATSASGALLAYYSFDSNFNDLSGNNNHLTVSNGTPGITTTAGEHQFGGGALNLDQSGAEQHLAFTTSINLTSTQAWSIVWWGQRSDAAAGSHGGIVGTTANSNNFVWTPDNSSVVQGLRVRNSAGGQADYGSIPDDNDWHHWAVVYDGDGEVEVWRDNTSLGTQSFTGNLLLTHVGAITGNQANSFWGQIDELYIFDEAISSDVVGSLFTSNVIPEPSSLVLLGMAGLLAFKRRR